jgi:DNA-binding response OmpR family regulator
MSQILIIEPDHILASVYKSYLEKAGNSVDIANNAQTAIMIADTRKPDAVILELQLIEHSGIEFLYEFRSYQEWQAIPSIIHTHIPPNEFGGSWKILKQELNVVAYMYKPHTTLKALSDKVKELAIQLA